MATKWWSGVHCSWVAHGLGPWSQGLSSWQGSRRLCRAASWYCRDHGGAHGDVAVGALRRPSALSPERKALLAAQGTQRFVDSFYHQNGNCGAVVIARRRARHSAAVAEAMCALQRLLRSEVSPQGPGGLVEGVVFTPLQGRKPCRGAASGGAPSGPSLPPRVPSRGLSPRGSPQAFRLVLSHLVDIGACEGRGEWALHTLESTGPTVAPGPTTGTARPIGPRRSVAGPNRPACP